MDVLFPFLTRHHWLAPVRRPLVAPVFRNQRLSQDDKSSYPSGLLEILALHDHVSASVSTTETSELHVAMDQTLVTVDDVLLHDMAADVCYSRPQTSLQTWLPLITSEHAKPTSWLGTEGHSVDLSRGKMKTPTADAISAASSTIALIQHPTASDVQYHHVNIEV